MDWVKSILYTRILWTEVIKETDFISRGHSDYIKNRFTKEKLSDGWSDKF